MNIFVIGVGGVGGYLGGMLAKSGNRVTFVAKGENYLAIKHNGLRVESVRDGNFVVKPINVVSKIDQIKNPDLIFIAVKTYDNEVVAKELAKVVNKDTSIITFQNGVENDLFIKKFVGCNVFPGVAYIVSTKGEPGVIKQTSGLCKFVIGDRHGPNNSFLKIVEKLMIGSGINTVFSDNITSDIWKKFIFISSMNGLSALARVPVGIVMQDTELRRIYELCVKEIIEVAIAGGIDIPSDIYDVTMDISQKTNKDAKFSMLIDIENKRRIEIETLTGSVVKLAQKYKVDVPINSVVYATLKSWNSQISFPS